MRDPAICTHVVAMALAHNLMLYPNFIDNATQLNIRHRLYTFGLADSSFHAYWKPSETQDCLSSNPMVKISYYKNGRGIFATIMNPTGKPQDVTLKTTAAIENLRIYDAAIDQESAFDASKTYTLKPYMALFLYSAAN